MRIIPVIFFYFTVFIIGCGNSMSKSKPANLAWNVESVTFYKVDKLNVADKMSDEELKPLESIKVKDPKLSDLFDKASYNKNWALWKGGHLATADLKNGKKIRIYISNYGNFFVIHGQQGFYFFEHEEDQKLWDYLFFGEGLKKQIRERDLN